MPAADPVCGSPAPLVGFDLETRARLGVHFGRHPAELSGLEDTGLEGQTSAPSPPGYLFPNELFLIYRLVLTFV